ncbi:hypothetical protein CHRY9293_02397 [Chryseobacterium potabilaquae]|uniref:Uncharacterized protein n=1 Tax=Chryseobacterium potabilaquae TaxID=2675057 RepID=A0A6N4XA70_9FLAO|nr:hypothetical protein CHRY9293_02397 [Chryseobacterium potabilaquae]
MIILTENKIAFEGKHDFDEIVVYAFYSCF